MPRPVHLALLALASSLPALCQTATNSPTPLSTRVVAYSIEANVDPDHHSLEAIETLTYKNLTGQPLTTFPFHLYLNAFRPQSTFSTETHFNGGIRDNISDNDYPGEKLGSIEVTHLDAVGFGDLSLRFTAPDDGNAQDHTVAEVSLPRPLAPGDSITFHLNFKDRFPLSVARNGYKRDFLMGGQWFPKPGVFWHGAWNCHQYHATTEFFSDFATFNVHLTLPTRFVVGASGVPAGDTVNSNRTHTLGFYAEDVGDFAFALSPNFTVTDGTYLSSLGPVKIHVLALKAHPQAGQRYLSILQRTMQQFEERYGPYPYKIITVIDPEPGSEIGGMEYPTLITGDTSWFEPTYITEITAEHEFGHQYWYGMVATNEFEDAWLDEGINSYTEATVTGALLGRKTSVLNFPWANLSDASLQRMQYLLASDFDPVTRHAWQFRNEASYGAISYGKSATLLATLEGIVGTQTMNDAMRLWFTRYRFTHPTAEDFLRTIEEAAIQNGRATALGYTPTSGVPCTQLPLRELSDLTIAKALGDSSQLKRTFGVDQYHVIVELPAGAHPPCLPFTQPNSDRPGIGVAHTGPPDDLRALRQTMASQQISSALKAFAVAPTTMTFTSTTLRAFFNQAVYGTQVLDYAVDSIDSSPVQWWLPAESDLKAKDKTQYLDTVVLRRRGDFILPVTVEVVFSDGSSLRDSWDGVDRWKKFAYTRSGRIVSAEIDPDHIVPLDSDVLNNSITTAPNYLPTQKLAAIWVTLHQLAAQLAAWIV